jgi:hypothetical protein
VKPVVASTALRDGGMHNKSIFSPVLTSNIHHTNTCNPAIRETQAPSDACEGSPNTLCAGFWQSASASALTYLIIGIRTSRIKTTHECTHIP